MKTPEKQAGGQGRVRQRLKPSPEMIRSAVSNGSTLIPGLDHRSAWARRLRDLIDDQLADLGPPETVSEFERVLVRRSAMLTLQAELLESEWADADDGKASPFSLDCYQRIVNTTRRLHEVLAQRLVRPPRDGSGAIDVTGHVLAAMARPGAGP